MSQALLLLLLGISYQLSAVRSGWPEGTYGLPRSKSGCPTDDVFKWNYGKRIHLTRQGSYSSPSSNLFGSNPEKSDIVVQGFCIKNDSISDGKHRFMPGKYCIFKKGRCPASFKEGSIYWDDGGPLLGKTTQAASGDLPDGTYNRNTRIEFCCRTDGQQLKSIDLPADQPFYLLKYGDMCQQVNRMTVAEHWVHWVDEKFLNLNHLGGTHPKVIRPKLPPPYTRLYYCYYEPSDANYPSAFASHSEGYPQFSFGVQTILTIIYVTGAILAIIFMLALLLTGCQKIFVHVRKRRRSRASCSRESSHLDRGPGGYPKAAGPSSPAVSSLSPPPYQQLPMGPLTFRGIRDQRTSEDSLVMCEDGEPPPPYEEVLREQAAVREEARRVCQ